jgi:uncharacterized protein YndB with AHSA1/START domain
MASITASVEVACPPETVFVYVTDPSRFGEWQENVTHGHMEGDGPYAVGAICRTTRRIGFAERPVTSEITHIDPPRTWGVRGIDGPIRARVDVTVRDLDDARRCALIVSVDFEGHAIGKLLAPLVRREATSRCPATCNDSRPTSSPAPRVKPRMTSRAASERCELRRAGCATAERSGDAACAAALKCASPCRFSP